MWRPKSTTDHSFFLIFQTSMTVRDENKKLQTVRQNIRNKDPRVSLNVKYCTNRWDYKADIFKTVNYYSELVHIKNPDISLYKKIKA